MCLLSPVRLGATFGLVRSGLRFGQAVVSAVLLSVLTLAHAVGSAVPGAAAH